MTVIDVRLTSKHPKWFPPKLTSNPVSYYLFKFGCLATKRKIEMLSFFKSRRLSISSVWAMNIAVLLTTSITFSSVAIAAGIRDDAPAIEDPLKGLIELGSVKNSARITIDRIEDKRVAVILSDNTSAHLKWSAGVAQGPGSADKFMGTLFGGQKMMNETMRIYKEVYEPKALTEAITQPLVTSAKQVEIVPDLATFQEGQYDLAVVLDVTFTHIFSDGFIIGSHYETGMAIKALFVDKDLRIGPIVTVTEKIEPNRNELIIKSGEIRRRVIEQYQQRMAQTMPILIASQPNEGASSVKPKASAAERLKALDELLKQGLISPAEAEAKRKLILADL